MYVKLDIDNMEQKLHASESHLNNQNIINLFWWVFVRMFEGERVIANLFRVANQRIQKALFTCVVFTKFR